MPFVELASLAFAVLLLFVLFFQGGKGALWRRRTLIFSDSDLFGDALRLLRLLTTNFDLGGSARGVVTDALRGEEVPCEQARRALECHADCVQTHSSTHISPHQQVECLSSTFTGWRTTIFMNVFFLNAMKRKRSTQVWSVHEPLLVKWMMLNALRWRLTAEVDQRRWRCGRGANSAHVEHRWLVVTVMSMLF